MQPSPPVLTRRDLNRALLARQMLLRRDAGVAVGDAVERLVGMQAQATAPPYYGLWSRLEDFDAHELGRMLTDRELVRMTLMRGTVHLVTVADALALRPLVQPVIERGFNGTFGRRTADLDSAELSRAIREILDGRDADGAQSVLLTGREIATRLLERGIGADLEALSIAVRVYAPLVQVPPRGVWGAGGQARYATVESWTGRPLEAAPDLDGVVLRYLSAFGPASVMDVQCWSGLTKLKGVLERLRPQLLTLLDEDGTELYDLPDAPRPGAGADAPPRLIGEFDNVLLSHADRRRIIPAGETPWMDPALGGRHVNNLLIDGMLAGSWWIERDRRRDPAILAIRPSAPLTPAVRAEVLDEARRMLDFAAAGAPVARVRFDER